MGHSDYDGTDYASLHKIQSETTPLQVAHESKLGVQHQRKALSQLEAKKRRHKKIMHLAQEISFNEDVDVE